MSQKQSSRLRTQQSQPQQKNPTRHYQHPDEKQLFALLRLSQRLEEWIKRLPLTWRILGGLAIVIGIIAYAKPILTFVGTIVEGLCMLGVLCFFFIGIAAHVFGGGGRGRRGEERDPITGFTQEEWDDMMDPRR